MTMSDKTYFSETYFESINEAYTQSDEYREQIIKISRDIQKQSKKAIYEIHRGNTEHAQRELDEIATLIQKSSSILEGATSLDHVGAFSASLEEYVEAKTFLAFVDTQNIPTAEELQVDYETYIAGLSDLTGELVRYGVNASIADQFEILPEIVAFIEELYGYLLMFNLRNGSLRKKFDSIKYNLQKAQDLTLELKLKEKLPSK